MTKARARTWAGLPASHRKCVIDWMREYVADVESDMRDPMVRFTDEIRKADHQTIEAYRAAVVALRDAAKKGRK